MDPDLRGNDCSGSGVLMESSMDAQGASSSLTRVVLPGTRPGQSASRDRTQSWWDVLPAVPKCGKPCFMCGAPCNRPLGKHFIRLCVGFVVGLPGKPMCIGCLSLGACLLVENYSMKTMESSCSHVRNITCQTSAMTHTREAFAFQGKV